jgi:hypothetical protein
MIEKPDMDKAVFCKVVKTPDDAEIRFAKFFSFVMRLIVVERKLRWKRGIFF